MKKITKHKIQLSDEYRKQCIHDILKYFEDDEWCKTVPKYQTWPILFDRTEPHWEYLKQSFFNVVGVKEFKSLKCWAYVSFPGTQFEGNLWHTHDESKGSAVFYLSISSPRNGTIFVDGDLLISPIVDDSAWYFFDSNIEHSPSPYNSMGEKKPRVVLAVAYD